KPEGFMIAPFVVVRTDRCIDLFSDLSTLAFGRTFARSFAVRLLLERLLCRFSNEVSYPFRLLQHGDVASWKSNRFSPGLFCTCRFHLGCKSAVFRGDHMP